MVRSGGRLQVERSGLYRRAGGRVLSQAWADGPLPQHRKQQDVVGPDAHINPVLGARRLGDLAAEEIDEWLAAKAATLSTDSLVCLLGILRARPRASAGRRRAVIDPADTSRRRPPSRWRGGGSGSVRTTPGSPTSDGCPAGNCSSTAAAVFDRVWATGRQIARRGRAADRLLRDRTAPTANSIKPSAAALVLRREDPAHPPDRNGLSRTRVCGWGDGVGQSMTGIGLEVSRG